MTEEEERKALLARIEVYTDLDFSSETLKNLRWFADTYDLAARLTRERGRLGAMWSYISVPYPADDEPAREK